MEILDSWCSCWCGNGNTLVQEECVWYEGTSLDDCEEKRSRDETNHGCGNIQISQSKKLDTTCNNNPCGKST